MINKLIWWNILSASYMSYDSYFIIVFIHFATYVVRCSQITGFHPRGCIKYQLFALALWCFYIFILCSRSIRSAVFHLGNSPFIMLWTSTGKDSGWRPERESRPSKGGVYSWKVTGRRQLHHKLYGRVSLFAPLKLFYIMLSI